MLTVLATVSGHMEQMQSHNTFSALSNHVADVMQVTGYLVLHLHKKNLSFFLLVVYYFMHLHTESLMATVTFFTGLWRHSPKPALMHLCFDAVRISIMCTSIRAISFAWSYLMREKVSVNGAFLCTTPIKLVQMCQVHVEHLVLLCK